MFKLWAALGAALLWAPLGHAQANWASVAFVSSTMGVNADRLCLGEATRGDIGCPTYAPTVNSAGLLTTGNISSTGNISANQFFGDGSGLTGLPSTATDRISSTNNQAGVFARSEGTVSFTLGGTEGAAYLHPTLGLVASGVSATGGISGTTGYFAGNVGIGQVEDPANRIATQLAASDSPVLAIKGSLQLPYNVAGAEPVRIGVFENSNFVAGTPSVGAAVGLTVSNFSYEPGTGSTAIQAGVDLGHGGIDLQARRTNSSSVFNLAKFHRVSAQIFTSNTARMTIDAVGNVGIGTASPITQLDVNGSIRMTGDTSQTAIWFPNDFAIRTGNAGTRAYFDLGQVVFRDGDGSDANARMIVNGKIGVWDGDNLQPPSTSLHVSGTLRLANGGEACDANRAGGIRYNAGTFEFCNGGGTWQSLSAVATAGLQSDRIVSGTAAAIANSTNGRIDISGSLNLPAQNVEGVTNNAILAGGTRLIHTFRPTGNEGSNLFIGLNSGNTTMVSTTTSFGASYNTGVGMNTLLDNTTGYWNSANGVNALRSNTTGNSNTAHGVNALFNNTTGVWNTAHGVQALFNNTTGNFNTANGVNALRDNTSGNSNTAHGVNSLLNNTTGVNNTAHGVNALRNNTTGVQNTAHGVQALINNTSGYSNTAHGVNALMNTTTGYNNTAAGASALLNNTTGVNNTALGHSAGFDISGTANGNTLLGYNTGRGLIEASNNTILGANVTGLAADLSNTVIIADGSGNRRIYVDNSGNAGIGTTSPTARLDVSGSINIGKDAKLTVTGAGGTPYDLIRHYGPDDSIIYYGYQGRLLAFSGNGASYLYPTGGTNSPVLSLYPGLLGVNTGTLTPPSATLHVSGTLRLADSGEACDADRTGAIRYTGGEFSFCRNGTAWETLSSMAGGGADALDDLIDASTDYATNRTLFIGQSAGVSSTGQYSTAIGRVAAFQSSGSYVVAVGDAAAYQNTGSNVTGLGANAAYQNTGILVTAVGTNAAFQNSGTYVTGLGVNAAYQNTGANVTGIGTSAAYQNTGANVTGLGHAAAEQNTGANVTGLGYAAAYHNTGAYVTVVGSAAAQQNSGTHVTGLGYAAAFQNTGDFVTALGMDAAYQNTGDNVVAIGHRAGVGNAAANQFILKQANVNATPLIQGDFASGNVGIGTTSPTAKLEVAGTMRASTADDSSCDADTCGSIRRNPATNLLQVCMCR